MMRILVRIFAVIGILSVLIVAGFVGLFMAFGPSTPEVPQTAVLEFDFETPLPERTPADPLAALLSGRQPTLQEVVDTIDRAARDPRVKGMVARVGDPSQGWAATQELRNAVARFRAAGKFALVHAETFGEAGTGMQSYYLASAFDEVWMQPVGNLAITGLLAELPFYRGTLELLRVEPHFSKRYEYKTAAEQFAEKEATPANIEVTQALVGDLYDQWVGDIATARKLDPAAVRAAVDRAPLLDMEAGDLKLIDRLGYHDEMIDRALERAGTDEDGVMDLLAYSTLTAPPAIDQGTAVAVIIGTGAITRGESEVNPLTGEASFGPAEIVRAFDEAVENPDVRAIIFRVASPGGSPTGSEVVRRAVQKARDAGKPVVVSMGDVAASGGYWVSMDADRIVAQPGTLTGSIGVFYGKMVTKGLTDWIGVNTTRIGVGENAGIWSAETAFTASEATRVEALLDDIYGKFTGGVAAGRDLPIEQVRNIAKGRVYTGRQALEVGLVDALGGYDVAMAQAREVAGLDPTAPVRTIVYPKTPSKVEAVMQVFGGGAGVSLGRLVLNDALADVRPMVTRIAPWILTGMPEDAMVMMPPLVIRGAGD